MHSIRPLDPATSQGPSRTRGRGGSPDHLGRPLGHQLGERPTIVATTCARCGLFETSLIHTGTHPQNAHRFDPGALVFEARGWQRVALRGGCPSWNGRHDCGREVDHRGDHVCVGCHDQWNRDEQLDADDAAGEWDHERPDELERCAHRRHALAPVSTSALVTR